MLEVNYSMTEPKLLTRDEFRDRCLKRDNNKCVFCSSSEGIHVHHIMERRLFSSPQELGGYFENNGASVCEECHKKCESTDITLDQVREACGITKKVIPSHLYEDQEYDKWGNIILSNGTRLKGELFYDESVQKIIKNHLNEFTVFVKYPRTYHLQWSENMNNDDRMLKSLDGFIGNEVIVTEKLDGENTSLYKDYIHARSLDSQNHPSRNWVKNFWSTIKHDIPDGWRICGENMYAEHSIHYTDLKTYFYGFSIWNDKNECLSWDDTLFWFELFGIEPVPVLYRGIFDENKIKSLWNPEKAENIEGYVVRVTDSFQYGDFRNKVGKFVRKNHIQTVKHWMYGQLMKKNELQK